MPRLELLKSQDEKAMQDEKAARDAAE
jgi:hypothetical protein